MIDQKIQRLAEIRAQSEKWLALNADSVNWETPFLLSIIDEKNLQLREGK